MVQMDSRIRVTESKLVGMKNGVEIYYIEGFYSQDESDPITLPVEGISNGSILKEVETGNIKQFSEGSSTWVEVGGSGGSSTLSGLTDVDISNPTNGQTLVYNATSGKWENGDSAGGGVLVVNVTAADNVLTLDKTWQEIYDADAVSIVWAEEESNRKNHIPCLFVQAVPPLGDGDYVYVVSASFEGDELRFETSSASGYPSNTE